MSLPLTEKYRPKCLEDILGNIEVIKSLKSILKSQCLPNMLFYGSPGTGKTTAARALAETLYPDSRAFNVLELNASDERGIETVRTRIKEFSQSVSFKKNVKLVILDEVDSMSRDAQNCMRRIMEDFSQNVRFCLIANYSTKIIPAIQSRTAKFRFGPVSNQLIEQRIIDICQNESINITPGGLLTLIKSSDGDIRKLLNDIQGIYTSFGSITETGIMKLNGTVAEDIYQDIFTKLIKEEFTQIHTHISIIKMKFSVEIEDIIVAITEILVKSQYYWKLKAIGVISDIKYRLSMGASEEIQLKAFIGVFCHYRQSN